MLKTSRYSNVQIPHSIIQSAAGSALHVSIPANQIILCIPGSLLFSDSLTSLKPTKISIDSIYRKLSGSSLRLQQVQGESKMVFGSQSTICGIELDGSSRLIVRPSAFICSTLDPESTAEGMGLLNGFRQLLLGGSGLVGIAAHGGIIKKELDTGEQIVFDPAYYVARDESVSVAPVHPIPPYNGPKVLSWNWPNVNVSSIRAMSRQKIALPALNWTIVGSKLLRLSNSVLGFTIRLGRYLLWFVSSRFTYHLLGERGLYRAVGPGVIYIATGQAPSLWRLFKNIRN